MRAVSDSDMAQCNKAKAPCSADVASAVQGAPREARSCGLMTATHELNRSFFEWLQTQLASDPSAVLEAGCADYLAAVEEYKRRAPPPPASGPHSPGGLKSPGGSRFVFSFGASGGALAPHSALPLSDGSHAASGFALAAAGEDAEERGDGKRAAVLPAGMREFGSAAQEGAAPPGANPFSKPFHGADLVRCTGA